MFIFILLWIALLVFKKILILSQILAILFSIFCYFYIHFWNLSTWFLIFILYSFELF